jgi:hypothetical protein
VGTAPVASTIARTGSAPAAIGPAVHRPLDMPPATRRADVAEATASISPMNPAVDHPDARTAARISDTAASWPIARADATTTSRTTARPK